MIRVLICDDDPLFLDSLYNAVVALLSEKEIRSKVHKFQFLEEISDQMMASCDVAFLDVDYNAKNYTGMDIARRLRQFRKDAVIIFVTNFIEYAPEGYEVQAFRYILKRNLQSELKMYLQQALDQLNTSRETIKIQVYGEYIDLPIEDVLYMEVMQHNVTVYVRKGWTGNCTKTYEIYSSLSDMEEQLAERGFLRIHKSILANMRRIAKFQSKAAVLDNGISLRVSEKAYAENKKKYLLWKGW